MADYTAQDLARAAYAAGFRGPEVPIAVAISLTEDTSRTLRATHRNSNGSVDRGPWQINSVHNFSGNPYDLNENARQAFKVYKSQGWGAWSATYKTDRYKMQIKRAAQAAVKSGKATNDDGSQALLDAVTPGKNLGDKIGDGLAIASGPIGYAIAHGDNPVSGVLDAATAVPNLIARVLSPTLWRMIGIGALAVFLLIVGVIVILASNKTVRDGALMAAGPAGKVAASA